MNVNYTKKGDYFVPDLVDSEKENLYQKLGKYGRKKLEFLKENNKVEYTILWMNGRLKSYLIAIDEEATKRENYLINEMKIKLKVDENLKERDQIKWVGLMNNIKNSAQEIVNRELIFN